MLELERGKKGKQKFYSIFNQEEIKNRSKNKTFFSLRLVSVSLLENYLEIENNHVDLYDLLSSVVLQYSCQERLGEVETGKPEGLWDSLVHPGLKELYSRQKVFDVPT